MDENKIYLSPAKEMVMVFVDGEWKQFIRSDIFTPSAIEEANEKLCECGLKIMNKDYGKCNRCYFTAKYHRQTNED